MTTWLAPPNNSLAYASFILGIVSAALAAVATNPMWTLLFAAIPALLAIIFGFIGISTANRLGGKRRTMAVWGVILGFAIVPINLVATILLAALFGVGR